jgi:hypothetical protein
MTASEDLSLLVQPSQQAGARRSPDVTGTDVS